MVIYHVAHPSIWMILAGTTLFTTAAVSLALKRPLAPFTRFVVACSQMAASAPIVALTTAHPEMQLLEVGSLALVAMYRDARVLLASTLIGTAALAFSDGWFSPSFTASKQSHWHEAGVTAAIIAVSAILLGVIHQSVRASKDAAKRQSATELFTTELEATVRERTAELEKAKERAESANRAKTDFVAHVSHEIRTPLTAILGMTELLCQSELSEEQRHYVEIFRSSGNNLLVLINDLLDCSKIASGRLQLEKLEFDLEEIVFHAVDLVAVQARSKNIQLLARIDPVLPTSFIGDPTRLTQVLVNLLGNAIKFTDSGEVFLDVRVAPAESRACVEFSVSDTGVGIPQEKIESIFEAFNQQDSTITRRYGGTGLGLAISRQIVESMGGDLSASSAPEQGSTFRFSIPMAAAVDQTPQDDRPARNASHAERTLIVTGSQRQAAVLEEMLRHRGLNPTLAASIEQAYSEISEARAKQHPFSAAMVDESLLLSHQSEVLLKIRKAAPETALVLLAEGPRSPRSKHIGSIEGIAMKPVRPSEVFQILQSAVNRDREEKGRSLSNGTIDPAARPSALSDARRARLLIADDVSHNRFLLDRYLRDLSVEISFAEDGESAVQKFREETFDLILMDVQMPVMDGLSATRAIRALERERATTPIAILALTASARPEDQQASLMAGCDAHLSKPISRKELVNAVTRYLPSDRPPAPPNPDTKPQASAGEGKQTRTTLEDELQELVPEYLSSVRVCAEKMVHLLGSSQFDNIQRLAHNIRGTGASYGFPELTRLAAAIERSAQSRDPHTVESELAQITSFLNGIKS